MLYAHAGPLREAGLDELTIADVDSLLVGCLSNVVLSRGVEALSDMHATLIAMGESLEGGSPPPAPNPPPVGPAWFVNRRARRVFEAALGAAALAACKRNRFHPRIHLAQCIFDEQDRLEDLEDQARAEAAALAEAAAPSTAPVERPMTAPLAREVSRQRPTSAPTSGGARPGGMPKRVKRRDANMFGGLDLDEENLDGIPGQIRDALHARKARLIDLFRQWDDDESGTIDACAAPYARSARNHAHTSTRTGVWDSCWAP